MCVAKGLTDEQKKFVYRNRYRMTVSEMAETLRIKPQTIRTYLNQRNLDYKKVCGVYSNDLTIRENEILSLMAQGFDDMEIKEKLCIEVSTVKTHLAHIFAKMGIKNVPAHVQRVRAVLMYLGKVEKYINESR